MTKSENATAQAAEFVIAVSSFLRHSSFVIRHSILFIGFAPPRWGRNLTPFSVTDSHSDADSIVATGSQRRLAFRPPTFGRDH
jgi:hypothetical protein